ncbi:MAG: hypothetical protein KAJ18_01155 [Candidatus Omnitrophica bacterium]|nr:hypothetical protein [Candidatus Omnitrophota bacterium]
MMYRGIIEKFFTRCFFRGGLIFLLFFAGTGSAVSEETVLYNTSSEFADKKDAWKLVDYVVFDYEIYASEKLLETSRGKEPAILLEGYSSPFSFLEKGILGIGRGEQKDMKMRFNAGPLAGKDMIFRFSVHEKIKIPILKPFISTVFYEAVDAIRLHKKKIRIVMLGDSLTRNGDWSTLLNLDDVFNYGVGGDMTEGFLLRLDDIHAHSPRLCFVMGGVNDLRMYEPEQIFANFQLMIERLKEKNIIPVIQSTLYTNKEGWEQVNISVEKLNGMLKSYALAQDITFCDLNQVLSVDKKLSLKYTKDGVHLNKKAYAQWAKVLIPLIKELDQ